MELSREDKIETMADLNRAFAEKIGIPDLEDDDSREDILKRIQQHDEECFSTLAALNNAWLAFDYVRGDKELKVKVEDVWKLEVSRHREDFDDALANMRKLAETREVDLAHLDLRLKWL